MSFGSASKNLKRSLGEMSGSPITVVQRKTSSTTNLVIPVRKTIDKEPVIGVILQLQTCSARQWPCSMLSFSNCSRDPVEQYRDKIFESIVALCTCTANPIGMTNIAMPRQAEHEQERRYGRQEVRQKWQRPRHRRVCATQAASAAQSENLTRCCRYASPPFPPACRIEIMVDFEKGWEKNFIWIGWLEFD